MRSNTKRFSILLFVLLGLALSASAQSRRVCTPQPDRQVIRTKYERVFNHQTQRFDLVRSVVIRYIPQPDKCRWVRPDRPSRNRPVGQRSLPMPEILNPMPNPDFRDEDELEAEQYEQDEDECTENEDWGDCNSHHGRDY